MVADRVSKTTCAGCSACANVCPAQCIRMTPDEEGFLMPTTDARFCVRCGLCEKVCPALAEKLREPSAPSAFAMWSLDSSIRDSSSSGGVFTELAKIGIGRGGAIVGAAFDERFTLRHAAAETWEDISKLKTSKYVQSDKGRIFAAVKRRLDDGQSVIFVGTPCEAAGLRLYLRKDYENLLLCDFICHGAGSPKAFAAYLSELERIFRSPAERINFRDKSKGWADYSIKIQFQGGKTYQKRHQSDWYMRTFVEDNLILRSCCASCAFKGANRYSDITLADFWGAGAIDCKLDYDKGTSLVLVHTDKGRAWLDKIAPSCFLREIDFDAAVRYNYAYDKQVQHNVKRNDFLKELGERPFSAVAAAYTRKGIVAESKRLFRIYAHGLVRKARILISKAKRGNPR